MTFSSFAQKLSTLNGVTSRLTITAEIASLLQQVSGKELSDVCYLLTGSLAPTYEGVVFQIADNMMIEAISNAFSKEKQLVQSDYKAKGDLGDVVFEYATRTTSSLSVSQVFDELVLIAKESGEASQERKIAGLSTLLTSVDKLGAQFLVRIVLGNLRLGFSDKTILDALATLVSGDKKELTRAYEVIPDIGKLAVSVVEKGYIQTVNNPMPVIGTPVMPMLAQRMKSPAEMVKKMGRVAIEPKFDGLRVLIHFDRKAHIVKAFTRNMNDISDMFPELSEMGKWIKADKIILDTEGVGLDSERLALADFQTTMQRRRKHEISQMQTEIPIQFQVFDVLLIDETNMMQVPYEDRRKKMAETVVSGELFRIDEYWVTDDPEVITNKHKELRSQGLEGVIVKKIDSTYVPGRLGWRWVKMKEAEEATGKLSDTVDCVIMGYTQGQGKRASFGIGQFLVGIRHGETIETVSKVGTGLTDDQFKELESRLTKLKVEAMPDHYTVHKNLTPDFWVKPQVVVELAADDITVSPNHTAGYALRFPRLVTFRDDKSVQQITTFDELVELFKLQKV
jgi:DNA ligase-1